MSGSALAQTAVNIDPLPAGPISLGNEAAADTAVSNNTTTHALTVTAGSTWSGTNLYGLINTASITIDPRGLTVNNGSAVYGGRAGIQNATGSTILASFAVPFWAFAKAM